jgi:hypothetical protein
LSPAAPSRAHNARYAIDLIQPGAGATGLVLRQTKHTYLVCRCACGHWTQAEPGRADSEAEWTVALTEWHLAGPMLVVFICFLTQRMRLSRTRVREFLLDWLGLELSTATINQCVHEGGRAVAPVVDGEIAATIRSIDLLHADETSWKEHGRLLWLWVFTCAQATLFVVGKRSAEVVREVLGTAFTGWLMSDGFWAYRDLDQRLRGLAHLIRKAHGLEESLEREAQRFGAHLLEVLQTVIAAVYEVRGGAPPPAGGLRAHHAALLKALLDACERHADSRHEKTRALARELLNDWDTFWVVLDHPDLPLTNNEAERALRHWVIARRIGMGTRTGEGTRAFANLASVIETCRKRGHAITRIFASPGALAPGHSAPELLKSRPITTDGASVDERGTGWQAVRAPAECGGSGEHPRGGARGRSAAACGDRAAGLHGAELGGCAGTSEADELPGRTVAPAPCGADRAAGAAQRQRQWPGAAAALRRAARGGDAERFGAGAGRFAS